MFYITYMFVLITFTVHHYPTDTFHPVNSMEPVLAENIKE